MKVILYIDKEFAEIAIAHALKDNERINSKTFGQVIKDYMDQYGRLCLDDHRGECGSYRRIAEQIVNKYYK